MKYILVSGGVMSGIGKGVIASSTGMILSSLGFCVTSIKIDPYINIDAGTMSPLEHGEVFVLSDGGEADLDLGNYERFLDVTLSKDNNITTGKIYRDVIAKERQGKYLGKTVQVVPHIVNEIQKWIERVASMPVKRGAEQTLSQPDICIIELGGTVGDIESMPFIEALRQFSYKVGRDSFVDLHVSLIPEAPGHEQKTKPTQTTVSQLRSRGLMPDFVMCRSSSPLHKSVVAKLALFTQVSEAHIIGVHDVSNLYAVPLLLEDQNLSSLILQRLKLSPPLAEPQLDTWRALSRRADELASNKDQAPVRVAFVGKYLDLADAYKSMLKALRHAALDVGVRIDFQFIDASLLEPLDESKARDDNDNTSTADNVAERQAAWKSLKSSHGVCIPGGFGERGVEGKIAAVNYARTQKIPFFGICLGLQVAVIEVARNVLGWPAWSEEFDPLHNPHYNDSDMRLSRTLAEPHGSDEDLDEETEEKIETDSLQGLRNVIIFMPEGSTTHAGGTMRLGERRTIINDPTSLAAQLYKAEHVDERHRHRYEVDPDIVPQLEQETPLRFTGRDETGRRMEIVELAPAVNHPFFLAVQFHPEFLSRPTRPSPPFVGFMRAMKKQLNENQ